MQRLFVGIGLSATLQSELAQLRAPIPNAKWVAPADYHITLQFLGDLDDEQADALVKVLAGIRGEAFRLRLASIRYFTHAGRKVILWVGFVPNPKLYKLQACIRAQLANTTMVSVMKNNSFSDFTPHITLARVPYAAKNEVEQFIGEFSDFSVAEETIGSFSLFRSNRSKAGKRYDVLKNFSLNAENI